MRLWGDYTLSCFEGQTLFGRSYWEEGTTGTSTRASPLRPVSVAYGRVRTSLSAWPSPGFWPCIGTL